MKFDDFDSKMRYFETNNDHCVLPGIYMVARLDGRSFTRLTKEVMKFDAPFDKRFRDIMVDITKELMSDGFSIIYGYTESDEISLLFKRSEYKFNRKTRKFNSILAGIASAKFAILTGEMGVFDCRISELPTNEDVVNYFRWRAEDSLRNALNSHCYWLLRKQGYSTGMATNLLMHKSKEFKNELLFQNGVNFNDVPAWQKRGIGVYYKEVQHQGYNPVKQEFVDTTRNQLFVDYELPVKDDYSKFISKFLEDKDERE